MTSLSNQLNELERLAKGAIDLNARIVWLQDACRRYIEPATYVDRDGKSAPDHDLEAKTSLWENDIIYALDCLDQREEQAALKAALEGKDRLTTAIREMEEGQARWNAPDQLPTVPPGHEGWFIVAVRRAHSGKISSFSAAYLNEEELWFEDEGESRRVSGWFTSEASDGDDSSQFQPILSDGDELMGWTAIPQFDPARLALSTNGGK